MEALPNTIAPRTATTSIGRTSWKSGLILASQPTTVVLNIFRREGVALAGADGESRLGPFTGKQ